MSKDIKETKIKGFDNPLLYDKLNYPQCTCGECPRFYFNSLHIGSRGSGKTHTVCDMVRHYETQKLMRDNTEYQLRTHLISPTIDANPIFKSLESLDMEKDAHDEYSDEILQKIIKDIREKKEKYDEYIKYQDYYKIFHKTPESKLDKLYDEKPEIFHLLEQYDYIHPSLFPIDDEKPSLNIIILDDLLGTSAFTRKTKSVLTNALIKNRHCGITFCILVQSIKAVPKSIRLNCNVIQLCKFQNQNIILNDLYEEVSNALTLEDFYSMYLYCLAKPYGSLIIDMSDKEKKFSCNFGTRLTIGDIKKDKK
jgi:hypothetical protein